MIVVAGQVRVQPETLPQAITLAKWMQQETAKEVGCIQYTFSQDLEQPNLIHIFERWETESALKNHFATAHMAQFNTQLPAFLLEKPEVYQYTVASVGSI